MFKSALSQTTILVLIFISHLTFEVTPASPAHIHSHHLSKEREEDGAYAARGHEYSADGKHRTEFDHEAILGSVKDAEEFDHLSPEESKRRLRILLGKMDLNKDQQIDRNELKAWILRSFKMLSEEESNERFEDADENQDGEVTWEEYKLDAYGDPEEDVFQVIFYYVLVLYCWYYYWCGTLYINLTNLVIDSQMLQNDKMLFKAADKNGDGALDKSEFIYFTHPEEYPEMLPHILQNTLDEKDKNKDGFIDFQEFLGDRARNHDKEWLVAEKDKFDRDFDKDHDGKLNANEILSWVVPSDDEIAEEEVIHLFDSADDNGDNVLSFEEVLENHETFVGSEATDYGEHLHNIHTFEDEL
ncbi:hypothetical protein AAG570_001338 [Ranatra chinensis]|uniref:Reticulocalbin-3 n=1 Tax=Ranatra chinensis TaxID=642074 RepID=A0ABD0YBM0_9HEMI